MEEPWKVRLLVGLWLFWQRLRSGDLEGHILGFYCAEAPPAELKSLNVYKVYFCSRSSSLFPNKYQANINMCTTAPLPLPSWSRPLIIEENFSFCTNLGRPLWYVATYNWGELFFLCESRPPPLILIRHHIVNICQIVLWTSEDKLRDWDKRDMTYKHLYQFHSLTSDRIGW